MHLQQLWRDLRPIRYPPPQLLRLGGDEHAVAVAGPVGARGGHFALAVAEGNGEWRCAVLSGGQSQTDSLIDILILDAQSLYTKLI